MREWQPAETAPKDGTAVLGYFGNTAGDEPPDMSIVRVHVDSGAWVTCDVDWFCVDAPTHWMPLPEPPVVSPPRRAEGLKDTK